MYERLFETWINRARQILKDLPTGSISTVNDAAPLPLNALKVSVEAWQEGSGDPSPSNVRPIHGWSQATITDEGKNKLQITATTTTSYGVTFTINDNGTITANGKATAMFTFEIGKIAKNGTYIINGCPSGGGSNNYMIYALRGNVAVDDSYDTGEGSGIASLQQNDSIRIRIQNNTQLDNLIFKEARKSVGG